MAQELIYTSYPKGVKPGVSGFCTVAVSPDMAPNMISRLEGLSGYRHLYMPGTPEAEFNPPNWSHVVISVGNAESHVVYRVADAGLDYTGRSNKLAHFVVLDKSELAPCGPAAMLTTPGLIDLTFDQQVGTRAFNRPIPRQLVSPRPCLAWRQAAGDPGWAGELAQTAWTGKYACIVYKPGMNVLALIQEAMALLPPERRWKTTFSTYYSKLPTGIDCQWRCVVAGTPEAAQAIAEVGSGLVIDLSNGALASAPDSPAAASARAGRMVSAPVVQKSAGSAARPRPVQASQSAVEAAVNAGIQEELQTIDSAAENDLETDLISALDSAPQFTLKSRKKKKGRAASGVNYGMYAAIIAGIVLLGVVVATICVVTTNSTQVGENRHAVNPTNQNNSDEDPTTGEAENPQPGQIPDADQNPVNGQNEDADPVTDPNAEPDQNPQQEEGNKVEGSDNAENAQPTEQNADAAVNAANDQNNADSVTDPNAPVTEPKAPETDANAESEQQKEDKPSQEKEQTDNSEEDVFNDPRWAGIDNDLYFIYVDSNSKPDYTRLDRQLQNRNAQITSLKLIQIENRFKLEKKDDACYDLNNLSDVNAGKILLNDNKIRIQFRNAGRFNDFAEKSALLVVFSDNSSKVVSFFKEFDWSKASKEHDMLYYNMNGMQQANIQGKYNSSWGSILSKTNATLSENKKISDYFSNIKIVCYNDKISARTEDKEHHEIIKDYVIKSCKPIADDGKFVKYEIRIGIDQEFEVPVNDDGIFNQDNSSKNKSKSKPKSKPKSKDGWEPQKTEEVIPQKEIKKFTDLVIYIRPDYINPSNIRCYIMEWYLLCKDDDDYELTMGDTNKSAFYCKYTPNLFKLVKQLLVNLPIRMDIYLEDANSQLTNESFLWKRFVLPPSAETKTAPPSDAAPEK